MDTSRTSPKADSTTGHDWMTVDGNEAAAHIAHRVSEVVAIYPITPASPMGELIDAWAQAGIPNIWGTVPDVIEMQSEGGAAGTLHGSLQAGAMTTTFTASQGLLLMIPNLYKIAGELTPAVIHVAARSLATHALSIFGDHSDVMAARQTGMAMLASGSVQEAHDLALIAHSATLKTRVPFLHFFDGFRTSHEVSKIAVIPESTITSMIDDDLVAQHRERGLNPNRPVLRGTAQNPDVFFQAREACNPFHLATPKAVQDEMNHFAQLTGRSYNLFDYYGAPDAEKVIILMGSGVGTAVEAIEREVAAGEKVGVLAVRLYRPFDVVAFNSALPATATSVAVLDRTKEPGSVGEPLYTDVIAALVEQRLESMPRVIGGRYGLSSKEFTPAMVLTVLDELAKPEPKNHFTLGIFDDVTHTSLAVDESRWAEPDTMIRAVFYGLGSDGTVGANKNSIKIIGNETTQHAQGYFVYDSKKSGSMTVSHLRFGPEPIRSAYLIQQAGFVACHHPDFLDRVDVLGVASEGATFLLNTPHRSDTVWRTLPIEVQEQIIAKKIDFWVVNGSRVAAEAKLAGRINTVLQTCFFHLAGVLPAAEATTAIKTAIKKSYGQRGQVVLDRNYAAVDGAIAALAQVTVPAETVGNRHMLDTVPPEAPDFVQRVTAMMMNRKGDLLPVSALPVDGTFSMATSQWEKRSIASEIPIWDPEICIDCARCALVCPHAAIRMKVLSPESLTDSPASFQHKEWTGDRGSKVEKRMVIQVAPDDCTGCGVCVSICPAKSKEMVKHKAIDMEPKTVHLESERINFAHFLSLPEADRTSLDLLTIKGTQQAQPLFEFSGACSGCGETPYLKLLSQQFGDRILISNATGCSSIYGANLPTTPWATNTEGRGPAWANSLFEDNAEFGLGMRMALDHHETRADQLLADLQPTLGSLATEILAANQSTEQGIADQRTRVGLLKEQLAEISDVSSGAAKLLPLADYLVHTGVWIVGGDGWAYDIGFGGLDHVLASGRNVNVLVLDTEVYSNTGGQKSKATPRAAIAKFAAGGKRNAKKDLGMIAMAYGDVYVAQVAMGANMTQVVKAFAEAEAHPGPSLIIAYSPCIAHGIDMTDMMGHQKMAADSGYWPMYRFDPNREADGEHALRLDSRKPKISFRDFAMTESRFAMLARSSPDVASELFDQAQHDIDNRWHLYEQMVDIEHIADFGEEDQ